MLPTGDYRTKLEVKAEAIATALTSGGFDFALLHVKAVDDTGHDRLPWMKVRTLPCQMHWEHDGKLSGSGWRCYASSDLSRYLSCEWKY